jgi:ABC-2 type transport system permease protein
MNILLAFIKKELTQTFRDKRFRFILFGAPVIQLIIFGYVVTTEIKNVSLIVIDYAQTQESRELSASFTSSGYFKKVRTEERSIAAVDNYLKSSRAKVVLIIPPDFSRSIRRGETAQLEIAIDGADANAAIITRGYVEDITRNFAQKLLERRQNQMPHLAGMGVASIVVPEIRILYNQEMKSSHYMVPGMIAMILLITTALLTAVAITREKELGTLEQIIVSPLARWQFILGKTLPYVLVGFIDVLLILATGKILFDIPIRGSIVLLFLSAIVFLFTTLGIGLLAASVSKNQAQAMLTVFPLMMPALLLSGFVFPVASIPIALRWIAYINPITYYLTVVRGILIKGAGISELYAEMLILLGFGLFFIVYSSLRFSKRMK